MQISEFITKWNSIPEDIGIVQLLSNDSLLCFGRDYENRKTMLFLSTVEPLFDVKSSSFSIKREQVGSRWQTSIFLNNKNEEEVFTLFLWDLFEYSLDVMIEHELIKSLHKRLVIWEKLFDKKSDYLSLDSIQGIIGELVTIKEVILQKHTLGDAILGWRGPLGEDQDFVLNEEWLEVKSIRYGKEKLTISSLEQLGRTNIGRLVLVEMEQSSEIDPLSTNLYDIVHDLKMLIGDDVGTQLEFERRLLSIGYKDDIEYRKFHFTLKRIRDYIIDEKFPKLTRNTIRSEIINATYTLSIPTIEAWRGNVNYEY